MWDIWGALNLFVKLLEKLFTINYSTRRELFNEIIQPLYKEFEDINRYYLEMLDEAERCLPIKRTEKPDSVEWTISEQGEKRLLSLTEEDKEISSVMAKARKLNENTDVIRELFREKISALLERIKHKQEKRFLFCLIAYFGTLVHEGSNYSDPNITIASIEKMLSGELNTDDFLNAINPTSIGESLEDLLLETRDYEYPREFVHNTRIWLKTVYVKIGVEYQNLYKEIIEKTPKV